MISYLTEQKLAETIATIAIGERALEISRQKLAEVEAFEPYTSFRRIDRTNKGFITAKDIQEFFHSNEIEIPLQDAQIVIQHMDKTKSGTISFEEYQDAILPKNNSALKQKAMGRSSYFCAPDEFLENEVEIGIIRFFETIIKNKKTYDIAKEELRSRYDFNIRNCFNSIDLTRQSFLNLRNIDTFVRVHGKPLAEDEIIAFIQYGDTDLDSKLSQTEFAEMIMPGVPSPAQTSPMRPTQLRLSPSKPKPPSPLRTIQPLKPSPSKQKSIASPLKTQGIIPQPPLRVESKYSPEKQQIAQQPQLSQTISEIQQKKEDELKKTQSLKEVPEQMTKSEQVEKQQAFIEKQVKSQILEKEEKKQEEMMKTKEKQKEEKEVKPIYQQSEKISKVESIQIQPTGIQYSPSRAEAIMRSPSKAKEEAHLMAVLKQYIELERELQRLRINLSQKEDFNLHDAFRLFDVKKNEKITIQELEQGLNRIGIFPTQIQLHLLFTQFDKDQDKLLSFGEFAQMFYTLDKSQIELLNKRAPKFVEPLVGQSIYDILSYDTRQLFKQLLRTLLSVESQIDQFREELQKRPLFNLNAAFQSLDLNRDGAITYEELKYMLGQYGIYTTDNDILTLMKRFDKTQAGKIEYTSFVQELLPKSPKK